jgi:hypothetical protein
MAWALLVGLVAWSLVYILFVRLRIRIGIMEADVAALADDRAGAA